MRLRFAIVLALIILAGVPRSLDCSGSYFRDMLVPAVTDSGRGQIINISLEVKRGDGTAFIGTQPIVGGMTQNSGHEAMRVATRIAGYDESTCDVMFKIGTKDLDSIDGPSAGAAMTLLILSALKNENIRHDFTITGTIESNGAVGPVGGVPEKAQAAADAGMKLFITPRLSFDERLIVSAISSKRNITLAQVDNMSQVEELALGKTNNFTNPPLGRQMPPQIAGTQSLSDQRFSAFLKVTLGIVSSSKREIAQVSSMDNEYKEYFDGELDVAQSAIEKGYLYTGANTAFLAAINAGFLTSAGTTREKIEERARAVESCYKRVFETKMDEGNWEWLIGGQLRASWAKRKIAGINNGSFDNEIKSFAALKDLLYAEKWCEASEALAGSSGKGKAIQQTAFKAIAAKAISEAEDYLAGRSSELSDQQWHLDSAKQEFSDGLYGAAVYDATYAFRMARGYDDFPRSTNAKEVLGAGRAAKFQSLWASIYKSQMEYMNANGDEGRTSLQLLEFADGLENKTYEMSLAIGGTSPGGAGTGDWYAPSPGANVTAEAANYVIILLMILTLLAIIFVVKQAIEE